MASNEMSGTMNVSARTDPTLPAAGRGASPTYVTRNLYSVSVSSSSSGTLANRSATDAVML